MDNLEKLKAYQAWRRGGESSIFDTITTTGIGFVIDWAIDKCEQSEQVERESEQLKAQVERLRQLGSELINNSGGLTLNREIWRAASLAYGNVGYKDSVNNLATIINKTPAQCLAEIKVQAWKEGYEVGNGYPPSSYDLEQYANQLRQQAKAGE